MWVETTAHRDHARLEAEGVLSSSLWMHGRSSELSKFQSKVSVRRVREAQTEQRGARQHLVGAALENGPAENYAGSRQSRRRRDRVLCGRRVEIVEDVA